MLTISKRAWLAASLAALTVLAAGIATAIGVDGTSPSGPTAAAGLLAQGGGQCPPDDPGCSVDDHTDPPPQDPGGPGDPGDPGGGGGGPCVWNGGGGGPITAADEIDQEAQLVLVAQGGVEVPCNHPQYGFYSGGCYYGEFPPLVEVPAPPPGESAEDGRWYFERCVANVEEFNGQLVFTFFTVLRWRWFANGEIPVALPTPLEVAQDWLANIDLFEVEPALAPPATGAALVTLPVWLGVAGTANTWGPINDTHCLQTVCVSIEAQVATVDWTMGDGASFSCDRDQHEVWRPGMNYLAPGGNCHHYYQQSSRERPDGKYQITATSNWVVHWEAEASDASGDLETSREAAIAYEVDEIQVLTR
jgi:hypothetical protein